MQIDILTLFPELFGPFLEWSMVKKAREIGVVKIQIHNLRKWAVDKRGSVDDHPYGGGPGMILRIEPVFNALKALKKIKAKNEEGETADSLPESPGHSGSVVALLSPKGKMFDQKKAEKLSKIDQLILICGHYEGVDQRIRDHLVDQEISVGNYVLSGGEIPAMTVTDTITRLLPNVLKKKGAAEIESFSSGLEKMITKNNGKSKMKSEKIMLEFPHYTRPETFKGWRVPKVLLSGNHGKVEKWRAGKIKTKKRQ